MLSHKIKSHWDWRLIEILNIGIVCGNSEVLDKKPGTRGQNEHKSHWVQWHGPRAFVRLHSGPTVEELTREGGVVLGSTLSWGHVFLPCLETCMFPSVQVPWPGIPSYLNPWLPQIQLEGEEALAGCKIQGSDLACSDQVPSILWLFISLFENVSHDSHGLCSHSSPSCPPSSLLST